VKRTCIAIVAVAGFALFALPTPAYADAGLPMLALAWPGMGVALLPVIAIEVLVLQRLLHRSLGRTTLVASVSNAVSTLLGHP
jgi:hypothetical protein